jgi:hypothetical protein
MPAPQSLPSRLIGALFVERGLVSESQIRVALEIQRETGQQLGQVLVERFGVSRKELASVVAEQWAKLGGSAGPEDTASWRRLGDIFVDRGFVTQEELDEALARQRQTGERLGEALVAQGVISKFELAGALAEQMAALGDPEPATGAANGQPEATVHHLRARDDSDSDAPVGNVIDLVPPTEWGAELAEPDGAPVAEEHAADEVVAEQTSDLETVSSHTQPVQEARPAEEMLTELHEALAAEQPPAVDEPLETAEAHVAPVEEPEPAEAIPAEPVEALAADGPEDLVTEQEALEAIESHADTADTVDEPWPVEAMPEELIEALAADEPVVEEPAATEQETLETVESHTAPVEEPWPAEVMVADTPAVEVGDVEDAAAEADPRSACLAFAPTTEGYRLLALEAQPAPGETIDIPEVGEYLVLRIGVSPIPGDDRRCAYVEERVTPALVAAVAH